MIKIYGIKNCSSVKKGLDFLDNKGLEFEFLDIKKIDETTLNSWLEKKGFDILINLAGMTAKKLALNKEKLAKLSDNELKNMILDNPSLIKRPVIEYKGAVYVGKEYENL